MQKIVQTVYIADGLGDSSPMVPNCPAKNWLCYGDALACVFYFLSLSNTSTKQNKKKGVKRDHFFYMH